MGLRMQVLACPRSGANEARRQVAGTSAWAWQQGFRASFSVRHSIALVHLSPSNKPAICHNGDHKRVRASAILHARHESSTGAYKRRYDSLIIACTDPFDSCRCPSMTPWHYTNFDQALPSGATEAEHKETTLHGYETRFQLKKNICDIGE